MNILLVALLVATVCVGGGVEDGRGAREQRQQPSSAQVSAYFGNTRKRTLPESSGLRHYAYENLFAPANAPEATRDPRIPQPIVVRTDSVPPNFDPQRLNDPRYEAELKRYQAEVARQIALEERRIQEEFRQRGYPPQQRAGQQNRQGAPPTVAFTFQLNSQPAQRPQSPVQQPQQPAAPVQQGQQVRAQPRQDDSAFQPPQRSQNPPPAPQYPQVQTQTYNQPQTQQQPPYTQTQANPQSYQPPLPQPQAQAAQYNPQYYQSHQESRQPPREYQVQRSSGQHWTAPPQPQLQIPPTNPPNRKVTKQFTVAPTDSYNDRLRSYNEQMEARRRQLAKEKEEMIKSLQYQNHGENEDPNSPKDEVVPFTKSYQHQQELIRQSQQAQANAPPTPSTTRRPPKTTRAPLVYSNSNNRYQYGLGNRSNNKESVYQMQQRRRNEYAAQRQREREEKQRIELEQLQRAELQRKIAEEQAKQAAALAAIKMRNQQGATVSSEPAPLYPNDDESPSIDLAQYYDDIDEDIVSTSIPQAQLESPISPSPMWTMGDDISDHPDFLFDLPCNGFTDEICFQQQASLPPEEVHKCCQTKIVLTDQCAPGKCSNGTVQLCCIQKFLQSKFKCCNDRKQADALFATDSFSKCCFENFVQEDKLLDKYLKTPGDISELTDKYTEMRIKSHSAKEKQRRLKEIIVENRRILQK
uniref:BZIP domain-containing protein n=1 Tax=Bursaphelenchus xylophilus TaxID=6326 RepID=A0A1I7S9B5_BURXY